MNPGPEYPQLRMRRLRQNESVRRLCSHTRLHPGALILPLFVRGGESIRTEIPSMPGQYQLSLDQLEDQAKSARDLGLGGVILIWYSFGEGSPWYRRITGRWNCATSRGDIERQHS